MKYFIIASKTDDYGACNQICIKCNLKDIKSKVYFYKEIPKEHYDILKIYLGDYYDYYEDFEGLKYF